MPLSILSFDLPAPEQMAAYNQKARTDWIPSALKQPGLQEFRAYRNPLHNTPQVALYFEFDSMDSWLMFIQSEEMERVTLDMRAAGCTNINFQVWDTSPVTPQPLRPSSA
jgi:hypothetical protein